MKPNTYTYDDLSLVACYERYETEGIALVCDADKKEITEKKEK